MNEVRETCMNRAVFNEFEDGTVAKVSTLSAEEVG